MGNWIKALGIPELSEGLVCCATSAFTGIFSKCSVRHPRFAFSLFLLIGAVASFLVLVPNMRQMLDKIPYFCTTVTTDEMCDNLVGYGAVYRICFSLSTFYLIFAVFMINTTTTTEFRCRIHNGYWFPKLVLLVLILVATFHIPRHTGFGRTLMYAGLTGGFMFILIQVLLVIDFAHSWSISWAEKVDNGNKGFWYTALAFTTILIYSVAITMAVFFYLFFTDIRNLSKCRGNMFLITFNVSQCILASVISVLPRVQDEAYGSGLLQSSVVSLYAMYLTWCTLGSEPDTLCNPLGDVILDYDQASGVNGQAVFDSVLMFALLLFACNVRANTSKLEKIGFSLSKITMAQHYNYTSSFEKNSRQKSRDKNIDGEKNVEDGDKNVEDDEKFVEYNYSYFHFVMFLGSLQLMMVVTNWHSPDELADMKKLVKNWATVWIQLSASILCVLIYIWATVAPLLLRTWGPCLGLDYNLLPIFDDYEYERFRRRAKAMRPSDEHLERFQARKSLGKVDKSRQLTLDSGMCDTNITRSYSRSASRATSENVRLSTHSEAKLFGPSGDTEDIRLKSLDKGSTNEYRKDEGQQSRQSAVNNGSSNRSPHSQSSNEERDDNVTHEVPSKATRKCSTNSSGDKHLQLRATRHGNDRWLSEECRGSKQLPTTQGNLPSASADETSPKALTITGDKSLSLEESSSVGTSRKMSSDTRSNYEDPRSQIIAGNRSVTNEIQKSRPCSRIAESRMSEIDGNARAESVIVGNTQMISTNERDKTVHSRCHSGLSEEVGNDRQKTANRTQLDSRPSSRLSNKQKSGNNNEQISAGNKCGYSDEHRSQSETARNAPDKPRNILPETQEKSGNNSQRTSESIRCGSSDEHRSPSEGVRKTPDKPRNILRQMQDHIAWVKRLRKIGGNLNVSENKQEKNNTNNKHQCLNDEEKKEETRQFSVTESAVVDTKQQSLEKHTESFEIIRNFEKENGEDNKHDDSAIFQHPFVHAHGKRAQPSGPQAPDVSREIMRLQAKILKFQAKVVKTQQQILEVQTDEGAGRHETELPNKNLT